MRCAAVAAEVQAIVNAPDDQTDAVASADGRWAVFQSTRARLGQIRESSL